MKRVVFTFSQQFERLPKKETCRVCLFLACVNSTRHDDTTDARNRHTTDARHDDTTDARHDDTTDARHDYTAEYTADARYKQGFSTRGHAYRSFSGLVCVLQETCGFDPTDSLRFQAHVDQLVGRHAIQTPDVLDASTARLDHHHGGGMCVSGDSMMERAGT